MKNETTLQDLQNLKKSIIEKSLPKEALEQIRHIDETIALLTNEPVQLKLKLRMPQISELPMSANPNAIQTLVIDNVVTLMKEVGRQVTNKEILDYLQTKQIDLGKGEPRIALSSILYQEKKKKERGRIKSMKRGLWYLK